MTVWLGCFGSMLWLVSDQGSHFKNELVCALTEEFRISHHFTTGLFALGEWIRRKSVSRNLARDKGLSQ